MKIDYEEAKKELEEYIENNKKWVLSTSYNDYVTSRMMSVIHQGEYIFFQTNQCYIKAEQMKDNQNVSLCCGNVSIEGVVQDIGDWTTLENNELKDLYKRIHLSSYEAYGHLEGQTVYMVTPQRVKIWKYIDNNPIRINIDLKKRVAEQLDFM